MLSVRLRFEKCGNARFISHLDLMRSIARGIRRAGLPIRFTGGFSPKPSLVFGNPLSLGYESLDECCDFDILDDSANLDDALKSLKKVMPAGLDAKDLYLRKSKISDIGFAKYEISIRTNAFSANEVAGLLSRTTLVVLKHSKSGDKDTDILPLISQWNVTAKDGVIVLIAVLACSSDATLNPDNIAKAIRSNLSENFEIRYRKIASLNRDGQLFK